MKTVVFPGSFDPLTLGHLDLIKRAAALSDNLIILILENKDKKCIFSAAERKAMIEKCLKGINNATVDIYDGLIVDYMKANNITAAIRGIRNSIDLDYESQWTAFNQKLYNGFESIYLLAKGEYSYLSSSGVRQLGAFGGDISKMVPDEIKEDVKNKLLNI